MGSIPICSTNKGRPWCFYTQVRDGRAADVGSSGGSFGGITQLGECFPYKEEVQGSSPCVVTEHGDCGAIGSAADCDSEGCGFKPRQSP